MCSPERYKYNERRIYMSNLTKWDPFAELSALQKQFFGDDFMSSFKGVNIPTTDVYTKDDKMVVEAHLPNFEQSDINIQIDGNVLVLSADKHEKSEETGREYIVRESSSSFYRRIALPDRADPENIEAHLDDGILKVHVPLAPIPEPKKIAVKSKKK